MHCRIKTQNRTIIIMSVNQALKLLREDEKPGLSSGPTMNDFGVCGRQAAIKIMRRMTNAPSAIPSMAALDIETAKYTHAKNEMIPTIRMNSQVGAKFSRDIMRAKPHLVQSDEVHGKKSRSNRHKVQDCLRN